jgi:arginine decarboxylase
VDSYVTQAKNTYNIAHWSEGYFDIQANGEVVAYPKASRDQPPINLNALTQLALQSGLSLPILIRFTDILKHRVNALRDAFLQAIQRFDYRGTFTGVYPIKVNQQRHVVEEILVGGSPYVGLEAGSKPELMAVLGSAVDTKIMVLCNGYKDRAFIRLALIGSQMGHQVYIIVDKLSEINLILEESQKMGIEPKIGMRIRLTTTASGNWQNTSGERSKFGLSANQCLQMITLLKKAQRLDTLQLIHFNLGSQIANINDFQQGVREFSRYYVELHHMGVPIQYVNVGGGLAVDYEGTKKLSDFSMNYSVQEYANNVVRELKEMCQAANVPEPSIITESGRAMTAHHAVLITNITEIESPQTVMPFAPEPDAPPVIHDLWREFHALSKISVVEAYHSAYHALVSAQTMFALGTLTLLQKAYAESIFTALCLKAQTLLSASDTQQMSILEELNEKLADKLFGNFSLFQSMPDTWALEQIFPIVPLSGLNQPLSRHGILQDLTCDSDGRFDRYINGEQIKNTLPLPAYTDAETHLIGIFLVGAYQEILGDMHNLFGDTDSVHVEVNEDGTYQLTNLMHGDKMHEVLAYVHFDSKDLLNSFEQQLKGLSLNFQQFEMYFGELKNSLMSYTYLV